MTSIKKHIIEFKNKCTSWGEEYKEYSFIFNTDLCKIKQNSIKYILVADNPGKNEDDKKRYLVGPTGISARIFFERFFVNNFKKEVLVLNKTPIYTNITEGLKNLDENILQETQTFMVSLIVNIYKIINKPVIISGFAGCRKSNGGFLDNKSNNKNAVGKYFFSELKKYDFGKGNKDVFIIKHFSRMSIFDDFTIEVYDNYVEDINFNLLEAIGKQYREELFIKNT